MNKNSLKAVSWQTLFISFIFFILVTGSISILTFKFIKNRENYKQGNFIVYTDSVPDVLGVSSDSGYIDVYFNDQKTISSPLVFGGAQAPNLEHPNAWKQISDVGVTMLRKDFFLEYSLPNSSIENYISNKNGIADPINWKTSFINATNEIFSRSHVNGLQTMGIISYAPPWLTHSGDQHGVPKNWEVYEDMVKKLYRIHRDSLNYVEIWNEPSYIHFLNLQGSGLSREDAYLKIFLHGSKAIREVDKEIDDGKRMKIGGPIDHTSTDLRMFEKLLQTPSAKKELDFVSFHHYGEKAPDWEPWRALMKQYQVDNLPIYLTEWNYSPDVKNTSPQMLGNAAIPYTASMLIDFLNNGIEGANYYSLFPVDHEFKTPGHGNLAFYDLVGSKTFLLPQARTWQLLSKTLSLGTGRSRIFNSNSGGNTSGVAFQNHRGTYGIAATNPSSSTKQIIVTLNNLPYSGYISLGAYEASEKNLGTTKLSTTVLPVTNGKVSYTILAPPNSVVGVLISSSNRPLYQVNEIRRKLFTF